MTAFANLKSNRALVRNVSTVRATNRIVYGGIPTMGSLPLLGPRALLLSVPFLCFFSPNFGHFSALRPTFRGALKSDYYGTHRFWKGNKVFKF